MPLSTSSFEKKAEVSGRLSRPTWVLLALTVALYVAVEFMASYGLERISRIHQRIMSEARAAERIRHGSPGAAKSVLFLGNSLLLDGVDFPRLTREALPAMRTSRYVVEATSYYDWYYCLKKLFGHGATPDAVVLCMNPPQTASGAIRGDFSARYLFDLRDIWAVSRDVGADLTTTSSLYAAHFSTFYGTRAELRGVIMGKLAPAVPLLWQRALVKAAEIPSDDALVAVITPRFQALRALCNSHGAKFFFLIPPTRQQGDTALLRAGVASGVTVMRPIPNYSLGPEYYRDGFHLNDQGTALFTTAVGAELKKLP